MYHAVPAVDSVRLPIDVCHIEILLSLQQACDVVTGISKRDRVPPSGRVIGASKRRDQSVMVQP